MTRKIYPGVLLGDTTANWFDDIYRQVNDAIAADIDGEDVDVMLGWWVYQALGRWRHEMFPERDITMLEWLRQQHGVAEVWSVARPNPRQVIAEYETTIDVSPDRSNHEQLQRLYGFRGIIDGPDCEGAVETPDALMRASKMLNAHKRLKVHVTQYADGTVSVQATRP